MKLTHKQQLKRLLRQLQQRATTVDKGLRKEQYYQNKRQEFVEFINDLIVNHGFIMTGETTRIYKIYHDKW